MASRDAEDTSIGAVLVEMGLLTPQDRESIDFLFDEHRDKPEFDLMVVAYLINKGHISSEDLELAEIHQKALRDDNLLVQTRTRVAMAKLAASRIRTKIRTNTALSEAILRDGSRIKEKSTTSENIAIGFLAASKAVKDEPNR